MARVNGDGGMRHVDIGMLLISFRAHDGVVPALYKSRRNIKVEKCGNG